MVCTWGICSNVCASCFHRCVKCVNQEKCETVKIIVGKPKNNINCLTFFKNKAMLLHNRFYHVKGRI